MRPFLYILTALALIGLAFWAYRENYKTQAAIREVAAIQDEIADLREALNLQQAEWAYLNRPERLRDLVMLNFDRLGLLPMEPGQFGRVDQVPYPPLPSALADLQPIDIAAQSEDDLP
ncbi:MAG: cell division protein FtsL [Pseudorhodobacter sp.]